MDRRLATLLPAVAAIALVVVGAAAAIIALRSGFGFLPDLNIERSPLAASPPLTQRRGPRLSERVILVIADGLRLDASKQPYLNELREIGAHGRAISHAPTISRPNYVSIVTSVPPSASGVRNNDFGWPVRLDSIMARVVASGRAAAYVSDISSGFPLMFSHTLEDMHFSPWPGGFARSTELSLARAYPLLILLPGVVDLAGHADGADSDEYREAAARLDDELHLALKNADLARTTIVVVADHGHTDRGGHGGIEQAVLDVPIILAGSGIRRGIVLDGARLIDIAPTIAALLGVAPPGHGLGRTLTEVLEIDSATAQRLEDGDTERVERNRTIVADGRSEANRRVLRSRARRLGIAVAIAAAGIILLVLGHRVGALIIDLRSILFAVPAFPLALYAMLELAGNLSLSSLPDEGSGTRHMLYFGLAATGAQLIATNLVLRNRFAVERRLAAANALTVCGLMVAALPAVLCWALFGAGPFVVLPSAPMLFLIPALYLAVAAYSISSAIAIGIELVVFFARVLDPERPARRAGARLERARAKLSREMAAGGDSDE